MLSKHLGKEFKIKTHYNCNIIVIWDCKHLYNKHNIICIDDPAVCVIEKIEKIYCI